MVALDPDSTARREHIAIDAAAPDGRAWTDESALRAVTDRLGLDIVTEILEGGSSARVYQARADDGSLVAVKVLVAEPGAVDGHDLESFANKLRQIDTICRHAPKLGARYLPVMHSFEGRGWAAYTTPWFESEDTAACLRGVGAAAAAPVFGAGRAVGAGAGSDAGEGDVSSTGAKVSSAGEGAGAREGVGSAGPGVGSAGAGEGDESSAGTLGDQRFFDQYRAVIDDVFVGGYGTDSVEPSPGYLVDVHVGRFLRRFALLQQHLPTELTEAAELVVNGVACQSPRRLLSRMVEQERPRLEAMAPPKLSFPAHGDANTRNILVRPGPDGSPDFRVIDPRGSTDHWDLVYDLAKILFSLTVWDPALRLGFALDTEAGPEPASYEVGFGCPTFSGYRRAIHRFVPFLEGLDGLSDLLADDPQWRQRLILTHDLHVLAEAPCRLSDRKPKFDHLGNDSSPESLATGHYLLGTLLVNDLARQLASGGDLDIDRHLALVTGDLASRCACRRTR